MRIYSVADIHGRPERLRRIKKNISALNPDVLVIAGDITNFTGARPVIDQLSELPVPVLAVRGNTDFRKVEKMLRSCPNIDSLDQKKVTVKGIPFAGISGTIPVPFRSRVCLREKRALTHLKRIVDPNTVLVVHPPPRGIHDEVLGKYHAGSKNLKAFIKQVGPKLVLCGHIHENPGESDWEQIRIVNCAMSRRGAGAVIDYEPDGEPEVRILPGR